jgi:hypothetical protein
LKTWILAEIKKEDKVNMEVQKSIRRRVNISTSVKGVKTWDATVDMENYSLEEVLAESDKLVQELEKRYPITEVLSK